MLNERMDNFLFNTIFVIISILILSISVECKFLLFHTIVNDIESIRRCNLFEYHSVGFDSGPNTWDYAALWCSLWWHGRPVTLLQERISSVRCLNGPRSGFDGLHVHRVEEP